MSILQPYPLKKDDLLYYLHIPKTAGTSFTQVIIDNVGSDAFYQPTKIQEFLSTPPELVEKIRFIAGHLVYDLAPVITRNLVYLTMLRNPVSRTISQYLQIRRVPQSVIGKDAAEVKELSLLDFVKDPHNLFVYANLQTRQLGLDASISKMKQESDPEFFKGDLAPHILWYSNPRYADPQLLETAQQRLENFAFVGLSEQFEQSVELLCNTFGWKTPTTETILNVGSNVLDDVPQEALDIIHENTQLDAKLYEAGKRIFEERYKQRVGDRLQSAAPSVIDLDTATYNVKRVEILLKQVDTLSKQLEIRSKDIESLMGRVANLENQTTNYEGQIEALSKENERLSQIEISHAWRITKRIMNLRHKLIPKESVIETLYLKLRNRLV
jgi:hypothetical protein